MSLIVEAITPENAPRDAAKLAELKRFQQARIVEEVAEKLAAAGIAGDVWAKLVETQEVENRNPGALKSAFLTAETPLRAEIVVEALALFDQAFSNGVAAPSKKRPAAPPQVAPAPAEAPLAAAPAEPKNGSRKAPARAPVLAPASSVDGPTSTAIEALSNKLDTLAGEVSQFREDLRQTIGGLQAGVNTALGASSEIQGTLQLVVGLTAFILESAVKVKVEDALPDIEELNGKLASLLTPPEAPAEDEGK